MAAHFINLPHFSKLQVVMFARWRSGYASFMDSSELVLKNLYFQNWTRANDNSECGYAIYTIDQFCAAVKHAHTRSVQIYKPF